MSKRWVQRCEKILEQIKTLEATKDRDRLALVHSIRYGLGALLTSLSGWMQWINNPGITSKFNPEELEEMNQTITEFVKSFIEYDIKTTKLGIQKGLKERAQRAPSEERRFYV